MLVLNKKMREFLAHAKASAGLKNQGEVALRIGMPADRLKNVMAGRVLKLTTDEMRSAEAAFGVRRAWWGSDQAPMLLSDGERAIGPALGALEGAAQEVAALGLDGWHASAVQELLFNVRGQHTKALIAQLDALRGRPVAGSGNADQTADGSGSAIDQARLATCLELIFEAAQAANVDFLPNEISKLAGVIYAIDIAPDRQLVRMALASFVAAGGASKQFPKP